MISNLIQPPKPRNAPVKHSAAAQDHPSTAENCARFFVNGMGATQRERFKTMLQNGIKCGESFAKSYGVPAEEFILEVRKII